ncbi:MAG: TonB-dependent receptor [Bacteroidia bacterium]
MEEKRKLSAKEKALRINLNQQLYGSFAEIGAGQETAGNFFKAGGASGTVAKTMSAYDMIFSDAIYGESGRYVCEERLIRMIDKEYGLLEKRLTDRAKDTCFFAFANTVETTNFHKTNQGHGWIGVKFQLTPKSEPNECVIHVVLKDNESSWQQRSIGIIGVNLLYACAFLHKEPEEIIKTLLDGIVPGTVEVDMIRFSGKDLSHIDNRLMSLKLVKNGLTKTAMFDPEGRVLQPSEALYKKNALVLSGRFRPFTRAHEDMLVKASTDFKNEVPDSNSIIILSELSLNVLIDTNGNVNDEDFLDRVDILSSLGHTVMITNFLDYWYLVPYLSKATRNQLVGFALSARNIERIFDPEQYTNLRGGLLEALSMLFGTNVKAYVYPAIRKSSGETITLSSLKINEMYRGLLDYLLNNSKLAAISNIDPDVLHINADEILRQIQQGIAGWEKDVPHKVAELIKVNCLFDYPCESEIKAGLKKEF